MKITVEGILEAAERSELPNVNYTYVEYDYESSKPTKACLIGAAAIELHSDWGTLSAELRRVAPDDCPPLGYQNLTEYLAVNNNDPDRKVVTAEIRKLFSKSLDKVIEI